MYQSTPRTAGMTATEVLADRRPSLWPRAGGRVPAPASDPRRNYLHRGPHQATEVGREASGMGQVNVGESISKLGVTSAGTIASGVAISSGSMLGMQASLAVPVIGAAVAGVVLALTLLFNRKGPKQRVATTEIVNKVEPLLQENLRAYMAGPRTVSSQAQALENFKAGWAYVVEYCDTPVMGNPGQACVQDRQRGGQWDWWSYYYDPISQDSSVVADPLPGETVVRNVDGTVTVTPAPGALPTVVAGVPTSLLIGAAALAAAIFMGGKR